MNETFVRRSTVARRLFGAILVAGGLGAVAGAGELHGPIREGLMLAGGAVAGFGLTAAVAAERVVTIDRATRDLVVRSRLFSVGRRERRRSLKAYARARIGKRIVRGRRRSFPVYSVVLEGDEPPIVLQECFEYTDARRSAVGVAAGLGIELVDGDPVAGSLRTPFELPPRRDPLPDPPTGTRMRCTGAGHELTCAIPPPGFGRHHRVMAKYAAGFAAPMLTFMALVVDERATPEAVAAAVALAAAGLLPIALLCAVAFVWSTRLIAVPVGLIVERRRPFPRAVHYIPRATLRELEVSSRTVEVLGGLPLTAGPVLYIHHDRGTTFVGEGCTQAELEWLREAVVAALAAEPEPAAALPSPWRMWRPAPLVLAAGLAAMAWHLGFEGRAADVIEELRPAAEAKLAALARLDRDAAPTGAFEPADEVEVLHVEDLDGGEVEGRIGWYPSDLFAVRGYLDGSREPYSPASARETIGRFCRWRHVVVIGRARAIQYDLETGRICGGVAFDSEEALRERFEAAFGTRHP